jgi:prevent-host-death family protein
MERTIRAFEARRQFGKVLQAVARGDKVVVERNGEPVAAVVPIELYEHWKRERQAFFDEMREISERVNLPEDEAERVVAEAITAVRAMQPFTK